MGTALDRTASRPREKTREWFARRSARLAPAVIAFLIALIGLVPPALTLPQHIDEAQYAYISAYYGGKISRLDLAPVAGEDDMFDPGWDPLAYWPLTQPMGPRYIYAAVLGITGAQPPALPFVPGSDNVSYDPRTQLSDRTRLTMRFTALLLASAGFALIAYRLRWPAVVAIPLFLLIPHAREDLSRGWAEGPLLFGLGLATLAWGTRWFAPACGLAALLKLTALPLWLLAFRFGWGKSRYRHFLGFTISVFVWTALEPPAWFVGGPFYLAMMLRQRWMEFGMQTAEADPEIWGGVFGHYFPTRYLWPFELVVLLAIAVVAHRYWVSRRTAAAG